MQRKQKIIQSKSKKFGNKNKLNKLNNSHENEIQRREIADKIIDNAVTVLMRLDKESHQVDITPEEFGKLGIEIENVLNSLEENFGFEVMSSVLILAREKLGHTPSPLHRGRIQKLLANGFVINNTGRSVLIEDPDEKQIEYSA